MLILGAIAAARPELLDTSAPAQRRDIIGLGLLVALGLVVLVAPFACPWPDGLEKVAARLGFEHHTAKLLSAPLADYAVPGLPWEKLGTLISGVIGTLAAFLGAWAVVRMIKGRRKL
jgi:cobalt/nickel transport protein